MRINKNLTTNELKNVFYMRKVNDEHLYVHAFGHIYLLKMFIYYYIFIYNVI